MARGMLSTKLHTESLRFPISNWFRIPAFGNWILRTFLSVLFAISTAIAQDGLNDLVYTVGTTTTDTYGRQWAFLLWQGTSPSLISGQTFAIYAKSGDA